MPPYIIAELGVNHDGDPSRALQLTYLAREAGADAIKLQLFEADRLMSSAAKLAAYQQAAGERDPIEMLRRLELTVDQMAPVVALAHELGLHAIVTVFSLELVPVAQRFAWDAYKSASPDIVNRPLLNALAATGKPLILSTGASTLDEVARAVSWLAPALNRLALLQCVSCYPTPDADAEIGGIRALTDAFPRLPVGYSDHTVPHSNAHTDATLLGSLLFERHLTYSISANGPDHSASLDGPAFMRYAASIRAAWRSLRQSRGLDPSASTTTGRSWPTVKRVLGREQDVRTVSRQSLVTTRPLPAGHVLTPRDLTIKRPGTGIPPYDLDSVIGRTICSPIDADMPLLPHALQPQ